MKFPIRGLLIGGVVAFMLAMALALGMSSQISSGRALESMARELATSVAGWTIDETRDLLASSAEATQVSQKVADLPTLPDAAPEYLEPALLNTLVLQPSLTAVYYGNQLGELIYVSRSDVRTPGGFLTKVITVNAGDRRVRLIWRDRERRLVMREPDILDTSDPRQGPWYQRAVTERRPVWTEPYILSVAQTPGISVAAPVLGERGALVGVVGVDLQIGALSDFLKERRIGRNGLAMVLNRNGDVIAHPDGQALWRPTDEAGSRLANLTEIDDRRPAAALAALGLPADALRIDRLVFTRFEADGEEHLGLLAPFPLAQWPWVIFVTLPERDYLGAVIANQRANISIVLGLLALTILGTHVFGRALVRPLKLLQERAALAEDKRFERTRPIRTRFKEIAAAVDSVVAMRDRLRYQEERYVLATRGANDGLFDLDVATGATYFSPRMNEMVGLMDGGLGRYLEGWTSRIHPDDRATAEAAIARFLGSGGGILDLSCRVRHEDGSYRWVQARATAVRDTQGRALRAAGLMADVTGQKNVESQLRRDAIYDTLTGLPNRVLFMERLGDVLADVKAGRRGVGAVLYLDLDRFKQVNDTLGQDAGDDLLRTMAHKIEAIAGRGLAARIGSDQFAVMTPPGYDRRSGVEFAERIRDAAGEPMMLAGQEIFPSISVGVALCTAGYQRAEDVLADAALAMSRAKSRGRGFVSLFLRSMRNQAVAGALLLESDLRRALDRGEIALHYQPVMSLADGKVAGFEALMRWEHPERGMIEPSVFIPLAEETGIIVALGAWAMHEACRQLDEWRRVPAGASLFMSVNLSRRQIEDPDLVAHLHEAVESTGIVPSALRLEVTESLFLDRPDFAASVLDRLRDLGIRLSIDDFGTGYSSLSNLHRLPFDTVKIDKSFVTDILTNRGSALIVRTIADLAHSLNMQVVAEGAETVGHVEALRAAGCEYCQGFYFGRALPTPEARQFFIDRAARTDAATPLRRPAARAE